MAATQARVRPGYASKTALVMGVVQLIMGIVAIALQAISIGVHALLYPVGHGIWCGVLVRLKSM